MEPALDWLRSGRSTQELSSFRELARKAGG